MLLVALAGRATGGGFCCPSGICPRSPAPRHPTPHTPIQPRCTGAVGRKEEAGGGEDLGPVAVLGGGRAEARPDRRQHHLPPTPVHVHRHVARRRQGQLPPPTHAQR
eukprot:2935754-Rhodomonas_salina.1